MLSAVTGGAEASGVEAVLQHVEDFALGEDHEELVEAL